jgi:tRNA G46 methylase TrmB
LADLAEAAEPGCPLYFRTDFKPYFDAAYETIAQHPGWELSDEAWPFEFRTVFQERAETYHSLVARCKKPARPNKSERAALKVG